jgi:addiction module RelE/StbE family toxin
MAFKVNFSEQAAADLSEIIRYISKELFNPQAAERFYNAVNDKLDLLREQPYMFPLHQDERVCVDGYHSAVVGNFLLFYLVNDEIATVNIARILYGKRDIPAVLLDSP